MLVYIKVCILHIMCIFNIIPNLVDQFYVHHLMRLVRGRKGVDLRLRKQLNRYFLTLQETVFETLKVKDVKKKRCYFK